MLVHALLLFHSAVDMDYTCSLGCHMCLNCVSNTLTSEEVEFSLEVGAWMGKGDKKFWKVQTESQCSSGLRHDGPGPL